MVTDPDGIIRLWNDGAARIFGFSAAEVMGQSLDVIIPEKLRDRHWKGYQQTMATGYTRYGDKMLSVPATHRDGHRLSIEFSVALLRDDAGQIVGISAIMREVSDAGRPRRRLRTKCAELESACRGSRLTEFLAAIRTDSPHVTRCAARAPSRCIRIRRCGSRTPPRPDFPDGTHAHGRQPVSSLRSAWSRPWSRAPAPRTRCPRRTPAAPAPTRRARRPTAATAIAAAPAAAPCHRCG